MQTFYFQGHLCFDGRETLHRPPGSTGGYLKQGGVLYRELFPACTLYSSTEGHSRRAKPSRSSRMITTVTPAEPTFFCAPAKITPNWNETHHCGRTWPSFRNESKLPNLFAERDFHEGLPAVFLFRVYSLL